MAESDARIAALTGQILQALERLALGAAGILSPLFLASAVAIALALWLRRRPPAGFLAWAFPRAVWFSRSTWVDVKLWLFGRLFHLGLTAVRIAATTGVGVLVSAEVGAVSGGPGAAATTWHPAAVALVVLLVADFCTYWVHRIHHEAPVLWPFHAVHHSAEVMTPVTVYRKHPLYDVIDSIVTAGMIGLATGLVLGLVVGQVPALTLGGINAGFFLFNLAGANLRHSHVWLSYGPVLERIFISPAQHQIHHSIDPRHHNRNYGEVLAIWDWMFGTLYVPKGFEALEFGLADGAGTRLPQPHPTLGAGLLVPFRDSWRALRRSLRRSLRRPAPPGAIPGDTRRPPAE